MKRRIFLTGMYLALSFSSGLYAADGGTVKLLATGSSTVAPLLAELAHRYEKTHAGVRIDVQTGGSSRGIGDAKRGIVDMGMVSRSLKPAEADLHVTTIAHDGVTVILHASNPVKAIDKDKLEAMYRGQLRDWGTVGGKQGAPVVVVNKAAGRSTLELFAHYLKLEPAEMHADIVIGDNQQGIKTVAGNPNAIGYVSIGAALQAVGAGVPIKLLPIDGLEATLEAVANGSFPISRPLNVVCLKAPEGTVADFLAFAVAPEQADIVRQLNFVPLDEH